MKTEIHKLEIEDCVSQLLTVLDKDIEYLEDNLTRLDNLRRLVIKQDNDLLGRLLENMIISPSGEMVREDSLNGELTGSSMGCVSVHSPFSFLIE